MVEILEITTAVSTFLDGFGIMPYVLGGAVIGLVGRLIVQARKAGR